MPRENVPKPVVFVVDDEALIRWSLSEALADSGYETRLASSGAEARTVLFSCMNSPLVVVLDMRLPDVNDLSLAREVRARRPDAPLILMSAHLTADHVREADGLGVFRVIDKPFDVADVVELVGQAWTHASGPKE